MITGKEGLIEAIIEAYTMEMGTREYYSFAASKVTSESAKDMFNRLREWEETHVNFIGHLYQTLMDDKESISFEEFSRRVVPDQIETGVPMKEAMKLFSERDINNENDAIRIALEIEGKAYNHYRKMAEIAEDSNTKVIFSEMMTQEQRHINYLRQIKSG